MLGSTGHPTCLWGKWEEIRHYNSCGTGLCYGDRERHAPPALSCVPGCDRGRSAGGTPGGDPQPAPAPGGVHLHQRPAPGAAGAPPGLHRQGQRYGLPGPGSAHPSAHPVHWEQTLSSAPSTGLPSDVYAQTPELGLQLSRENQALHEENRTLRLQRDHLSQGRAASILGLSPTGHSVGWW